MKRFAFPFTFVASALLGGTLAACAAWPGHEPAAGQGATPGPQAGASGADGAGTEYGAGHVYPYGAGRVAMGDMTGDRQAMCELNRRMTVAATPEARQAVIDKYMGTMSPETRHHLMLMMREQCP